MNEIRIFYEQLYTSTNTGDGNFFENLTINNTLTETDRQKCEGYITKQEYLSAVAKIKNNKPPGPDGIPNEFYKMFSKELSAFLITVFSSFFFEKTPYCCRARRLSVRPSVRLSSVEIFSFHGNSLSSKPIDLKIGLNVREGVVHVRKA